MRILLLAARLLALLCAAEVNLEEKAGTAILSNGIITATVEKNSASLDSLRFRDTKFIRQERGGAYHARTARVST